MARVNADRNLLFGVLALQLDFISREALIAAASPREVPTRRSRSGTPPPARRP